MPSIQELFALTGRVAIVTGASRGLGEEMAEGLAEAGAALMICAPGAADPTLERFAASAFESKALSPTCQSGARQAVDKTMAATVASTFS
jgi:gluconate 5-dehydrogenase